MINVNLNSVFYMKQEVITNMIQNKKVCIIFNWRKRWKNTGLVVEYILASEKIKYK